MKFRDSQKKRKKAAKRNGRAFGEIKKAKWVFQKEVVVSPDKYRLVYALTGNIKIRLQILELALRNVASLGGGSVKLNTAVGLGLNTGTVASVGPRLEGKGGIVQYAAFPLYVCVELENTTGHEWRVRLGCLKRNTKINKGEDWRTIVKRMKFRDCGLFYDYDI